MTCNGCKTTVEKHLEAFQEVSSVSVNLERKEALIESASFISVKELQNNLPEKFSIFDKETITVFETASVGSELKQLKPLFIIFGYISIASVLLNYKAWNWASAMMDFMGLFFIVFSFFKLLDLKGFSKSFAMYDPG